MEIKFTLDQINELLQTLDKLPHGMVRGIVDGIKGIAEKQIQEYANAKAVEPTEEPQS